MAKHEQGYYCIICGEYKSNESFTGKGHQAHICKRCTSSLCEKKAENPTLAQLHSLPSQLTAQQKNWLKGPTNDEDPEISDIALEINFQRFPNELQDEQKQQLQIKHFELSIENKLTDEYGCKYRRQLLFTLERKGAKAQMIRNGESHNVKLTSKRMNKLLRRIVNQYEIYDWPDYNPPAASADLSLPNEKAVTDEFDEDSVDSIIFKVSTAWKIVVCYTKKETQELSGHNEYLPDTLLELELELSSLFEDEEEMDDYEEMWQHTDSNTRQHA